MTPDQAIDALMAHLTHRMNEFFDQNPAEGIEQKQLGGLFARWLYAKENWHFAPFKTADGVIAQHFSAEEVIDPDSQALTMARLKLFQDHGVSLLWMAEMWVNPALPMPDELRAEIVKTLRFHADKVESHDIDERLKEIYKSETGVA
jgi:hypothetical protein